MFTWICPTCGREVPPSYDKCPDCAAKGITGEPSGQPAAPLSPPPVPAGVRVPTAPPPVPMAMPQYAPQPPRGGLPTWLLSLLFAFAFLGLGGGVYWLIQYFRGGSPAAASAPVAVTASREPAKPNPLQKYVEVSGIRFVSAPKSETAEARFVIVNHSGADIAGLAGTVNIFGRTAKAEEEAAGSFDFKVNSLGPYESKEASAPVSTKLKVYELPDWQNVSTAVQITAP